MPSINKMNGYQYTEAEILIGQPKYAPIRKLLESNRIIPVRDGDEFKFYAVGKSRTYTNGNEWVRLYVDEHGMKQIYPGVLAPRRKPYYFKLWSGLTFKELYESLSYWRDVADFRLVPLDGSNADEFRPKLSKIVEERIKKYRTDKFLAKKSRCVRKDLNALFKNIGF